MTREFYEENDFDVVMERVIREYDGICTLDELKTLIEINVQEGNYGLAEHILLALEDGNEDEYWDYDITMGVFDNPVPITEKADLNIIFDDEM